MVASDAIRKKTFVFFSKKNMFFSYKNLASKKKKTLKKCFFLNTHLKEITS